MKPEYQYLYLRAPEPSRPRDSKEQGEQDNPYPDYEQSYIFEDKPSPRDDDRVVIIQL